MAGPSEYYALFCKFLKPQECFEKKGLVFYEKSMNNYDVLGKVVAENKEFLKELLQLNSNPKRSDLQDALARWNLNHPQMKEGAASEISAEHIFSIKNQDDDSHCRTQAGGIKMMISYLYRTRRNMKDGSKTSQEVRSLLAYLGSTLLNERPSPSPSPPKEGTSTSTKRARPNKAPSLEDIAAHFGGSTQNTVPSDPEPIDLVSSPEPTPKRRKQRIRAKSTDSAYPRPMFCEEEVGITGHCHHQAGDQVPKLTEKVQPKEGVKFVYQTDWTSMKTVKVFENGARRVAVDMETVPGKAFKVAVFDDGARVELCIYISCSVSHVSSLAYYFIKVAQHNIFFGQPMKKTRIQRFQS